MGMCFAVLFLIFGNYFLSVDGNAMLKPKSRGIVWARDAYNSAGYNYMGINCGGTHKVKLYDGKCGLCGDPYDGKRKHETGGKYATGKIAQVVRKGESSFHVRILLNTDQGGYFEFRLCVLNGSAETQACFDQHLLAIREGRLQGDQYAYIVQKAGLLSLNIEIPEKLKCDKCVLQWKYVTGNTFGRDEFGHGCLGCGPQETFINCADIRIKGWELATMPPPITPPTTYPTPPPTPPSTTATAKTTTTTTTTTTRAPVTMKPKQITKPNINTQPTRHRRPVTDFDEGSRRGYRNNGNYRVSNEGQTPAVVRMTAPKKGLNVTGVPIVVLPPKPVPAILPQPAHREPVVTIPEVEPKTKQVQTIPVVKPQSKPEVRGIGIPFHIPKPPKMSVEQIDTLNNNKNVIPQHDSLQKYVQVGSSKIIAAQDFATLRTQQVQTPPTKMKNLRDSTSPTIMATVPGGGGNSGIFTVFVGPMAGGITVKPSQKQENGGISNFVNEYSSAEPKSVSRDAFNQHGHSSVGNRGISINTHKEKPKVRYGRTPTPVPLLPSRYSGLGTQSLDPFLPKRHNKPLPSRYQQHPTDNSQQQQQQQQFRPRSTNIPVIETSTHHTGNAADTIAPWRPFTRNPNNEQTFFDKPLNLFKANKDTTFKSPVINERYTNFKIGSKDNQRNAPNYVQSVPKQTVGQTFDPNAYSNSELQSPENYLGKDGTPGSPRTEPKDRSVSSFVSRQSASTDNFNVYIAAGISNHVKKPNDVGMTLKVPMANNQKVNVLFDAFSATGNTDTQQQRLQNHPLQQQQQQQQQQHQEQLQLPQQQQSFQQYNQYNNENLFSGQMNYPDPHQQSNQNQQPLQQYLGHQNQQQLQYQNQYLLQQQQHNHHQQQQQQTLQHQQQQQHQEQLQLPQQQQFQGLPDNQVQFLGQYQKTANTNNANSDLNANFAFGPNPITFNSGLPVLNPTSHALWSNQNINNQTPPSTKPPPSPTPEKPALQTTTQQSLQKTTDKMDVQLAELRKLREKLDQLQQLINLRQKGFDGPTLPTTVETTLAKTTEAIPTTTTVEQTTQSIVVTNNDQRNAPSSGGETTRNTVRELLEKILMRRYKEQSKITQITTSGASDTQQSTTPGRNVIHTIQEAATTTLPSTMTKNTAEYIAQLKANMLKSIKVANEMKQKTTKSSMNTLRNKEAGYESTKPLSQIQNVDISLQSQTKQKFTTKPWSQPDTGKTTVNRQAVLQKLMELRKKMKRRRLKQSKVQANETPGAELTEYESSNTNYPTDKSQTGQAVTNPTPTQPRSQRVISLISVSSLTNLKNTGNRVTGQRKAISVSSKSSLAAEMGEQGLDKPRMREMIVQNGIKKQQIIDTSSDKHSTTSDSAQQRRLKLINRMKQFMLNRPSRISGKSGNYNRPTHLPVTRPSHLGKFDSGKFKLTNNRPVHIIDHPNNGRPTIYDKETMVDPQTEHQGNTSQTLVTNTVQNIPGSGTALQNVQQLNEVKENVPSTNLSLLDKVKQMIAKNKNVTQTSKAPTTLAYSTSNSRPTPFNKEMFIKMLRSMSRNRHNINTGR